jgi:predicted restriction endonuclease
MATQADWTRQQLLIAYKLYCQLPFGKFHHRNPEIVHWAKAIERTPDALAMKLGNIASLDPVIKSSGRRGLAGASNADKAMWQEMQADWPAFAVEMEIAAQQISNGTDSSSELAPIESAVETADYTGQSKEAVVQARIGQAYFRRAVLSAYSGRCCISGLSESKLLVASHIVPWSSEARDRLNPRNGLCLSALHDRAFDQGLIYLSDDLEVVLTRRIGSNRNEAFMNAAFGHFEGKRIEVPEKFSPDSNFIRIHREQAIQRYS